METEKWTLEDGRRAERRVTEVINASGETEKVTELHFEDVRPLKLQQRVIEKKKPLVFEREIQSLDGNGNIIEKKIEAVEPKTSMHLIEHHVTSDPLFGKGSVRGTVETLAAEDDCDCHVTKEEMIETIIAAIRASKEDNHVGYGIDAPSQGYEVETQGIAEEISKRMEAVKTSSTSDKVMWGVIVVLIGVLAYVFFGM